MAGNVWEWTSSVYRQDPFRGAVDARDANSRKARVVRGGSCLDDPGVLRVSIRSYFSPAYRSYNLGLRYARHRSP